MSDDPKKANADAPNKAPSSGRASLLFGEVAMSALLHALAKRMPANSRGFTSRCCRRLVAHLFALFVDCRRVVVVLKPAAPIQPIGASARSVSTNGVERRTPMSRHVNGGMMKLI